MHVARGGKMDKQNYVDLKEYEKEAQRSLINRWRKNLMELDIPYFNELCSSHRKEVDTIIEEIREFLVKEEKIEEKKTEAKFVFLGEKSKTYRTLKRLDDLNTFLLKNILITEEEKNNLKEENKDIEELKRCLINEIRFESDNKKDLVDIFKEINSNFSETLHKEERTFSDVLTDYFDPRMDDEAKKELGNDIQDTALNIGNTNFILATLDIFNTLFLQLVIYRFSHEEISKDKRLDILNKINKELIRRNKIIGNSLEYSDFKEINDIEKLTKKDIYVILYKFFARYKVIYEDELLKKIQNIVLEDNQFTFENISILEIFEYFDSLEKKEDEFKSNWTEKKMLQKLSSENKKRDNLLKQKIGIIDEVIELMKYSLGRNLNKNNFKNIKVIYHEFFKNDVKLPSSKNSPKHQLLKFYNEVTKKRELHEKLCKDNIGNKLNSIQLELSADEIKKLNTKFEETALNLVNFFTKEELTFFSEKITRGHYVAEDMSEEYKVMKSIGWELFNFKNLTCKFDSELTAIIEADTYINEVFFFMELLAAEHNLNDYKSISINDLLV